MDDSQVSVPGEAATCRICRSEGTPEEPLFHPCRCSGSIKNVHQECLVEWLSHSHKKHCELCKTPFRFTKLYDAQMPALLPWNVFVKRALVHFINGTIRVVRALLVTTIWMIILPWFVRWAWRWMFWFADAGWARDIYIARLSRATGNATLMHDVELSNQSWTTQLVTDSLHDAVHGDNLTTTQVLYDYAVKFLISIGIETFANTTTHLNSSPYQSKHTDASIFSSVSYISALTPYPSLNRIVLDIFEGQLITCTVILAFILVFLIREWVVQQQPVVNLDQLNQEREGNENADRQRQRIQLLEQARRTLEELENTNAAMNEALNEQIGAAGASDGGDRRPSMPDRDASSRVLRVKRLIEEADAIMNQPQSAAQVTRTPRNGTTPSQDGKTVRNQTFTELPVTNAGPDAKINIKWKVTGNATAVPPPRPQPLISNEELARRLVDIQSTDVHDGTQEAQSTTDATSEVSTQQDEVIETFLQEPSTSLNATVGETSDVEETNNHAPPLSPDDLNVDLNSDLERRIEDQLRQTAFERFADWFWGDITVNNAEAPAIIPDEQRIDEQANAAPFVPVNQNADHPDHQHDPEVVAAAQQAGVDAEAVEEAEDIEGILELIGLQGPLAGLLQTSLFCLLLVICTVAGAVVCPYLWGKVVLSIIASPIPLLLTTPFHFLSFMANLVVDITLFFGGWLITVVTISVGALIATLHSLVPKLGNAGSYIFKVSDFAMAEASASGDRLYGMFASKDGLDPLGINTAFLSASAHSHASLKSLQAEVDAVLGFTTALVRKTVEVIAFGQINEIWSMLKYVLNIAPSITATVRGTLTPYIESVTSILKALMGGNLVLPSTPETIDPVLVYWNSTDRTLAVCAGYAALAFLAAIYVAADTPITRSFQKTEKIIRDSLRQAGGVFKVILIISIEMLVFPFYCGMLLDLAFLPLFADATIGSRLSFASTAPYVFCFVHWFIGTCYMFHFALFVGMCRKILRKGVLWFIRDPDDPTFHPVRDVLERNVTTQLRKIAFSALVYGALVILCLGGVIWGIGKVFKGIFPIYWTATEPTVEFPADLLLYNFIAPIAIRLLKPSEVIHAMYAWWLRRCARLLRLSHFLFDERKIDEEGSIPDRAWTALTRFLQPGEDACATLASTDLENDGQYVLTPCNDQYRPPKPNEAFLHVEDDDVYVADKEGKRNEHFAKVYIPPLFKTRMSMFMVCLWIFSAFAGLCATLLPLVLGRRMLGIIVPEIRLNDIYAYSLGAYVLAGFVILARNGLAEVQRLKTIASRPDLAAWGKSARNVVTQACRVTYVYGFVLVVLPLILGIIVEVHFMIPLHTYFMLSNATKLELGSLIEYASGSINSTVIESANSTIIESAIPVARALPLSHKIHIIQDLTLGVLILRIISRAVLSNQNSRAAETVRRAVSNGRLQPDAKLTTRYLVIPTTILAAIIILLPPLGAYISNLAFRVAGYSYDQGHLTLLYRFSYPITSASIMIVVALRETARATARWRAKIRDEVYLVGERLHNFGEKRPPAGSRSVMRRDPLAV